MLSFIQRWSGRGCVCVGGGLLLVVLEWRRHFMVFFRWGYISTFNFFNVFLRISVEVPRLRFPSFPVGLFSPKGFLEMGRVAGSGVVEWRLFQVEQ